MVRGACDLFVKHELLTWIYVDDISGISPSTTLLVFLKGK